MLVRVVALPKFDVNIDGIETGFNSSTDFSLLKRLGYGKTSALIMVTPCSGFSSASAATFEIASTTSMPSVT